MKKLIANSFIVVLAMSSLAYAQGKSNNNSGATLKSTAKRNSHTNVRSQPTTKTIKDTQDHLKSDTSTKGNSQNTPKSPSIGVLNISKPPIIIPKKEQNFADGYISTSRSTNLIDHQDGTRQDGMDYTVRLNLRMNADFTLRAQTGYSQDLKNSENNDFSNSSLNLVRKPFAINSRLNMSYRIGASLPTSKLAYKQQSLQSAATVGISFLANPEYLIKGFDISALMTATRNIHKYEEAYDGSINTKMSSTQVLSMSYTFANEIYLSANFTHINTWNYNNTMNDSFDLSQIIGYTINPTFSFGAGHTNSGKTLKANGYESNVQIYDKNASMVYAFGVLNF